MFVQVCKFSVAASVSEITLSFLNTGFSVLLMYVLHKAGLAEDCCQKSIELVSSNPRTLHARHSETPHCVGLGD